MIKNIVKYKNKQIMLDLIQNNKFHLISISHQFNYSYLFPDEDICLFKDFPFQRLIYPLIILSEKDKCTCLLLWLSRYNNYSPGGYDPCPNRNKICNYTQMLNKCDLYKFKRRLSTISQHEYDNFYSEYKDEQTRYNQRLADVIVYNFLFPIIGFIGFVLNLLNVLVLTNKKCEKDLNKSLYKFMLFNSILSCLICFTSVFQFSVRCTTSSGRFCVDTEYYPFARYFFLIAFNYLVSVLKMASNCTHLMTSIDRYILCINGTQDEKDSKLAKFYKKFKLKTIFEGIISISLLLNIIKFFQCTK
jgi:hypothetical protein